jgi:hypothetical protein
LITIKTTFSLTHFNMDDLLLLIDGLMKIALLTGIMVLVATAPSRAAAAAGHGLPGVAVHRVGWRIGGGPSQ